MNHVEQLVKLGPRTPGSGAMFKARKYIITYLTQIGVKVEKDKFPVKLDNQTVEMQNIVAVIPGRSDDVIAIGGHYDTKPIPGANDGGSSAGLLMELCRCLLERNTRAGFNHTIWLVFFDGEDTGNTPDTMFYGSRHLAQEVKKEGVRMNSLVLVDMIGDKNLGIAKDRNSDPELTELIWSVASDMGYGRYFRNSAISVLDDHIPFSTIGVPSSVIIDFKYGPMNCYWHTQKDDLDKISPQSLKIVGDVVYRVLATLDQRS